MRAFIKTPLLLLLMIFALSLLTVMGLLRLPRDATRRWLYRVCMFLCGIRMQVEGVPVGAPALVVSNHCSYLDVIMLGASADLCFTPKSDVEGWPLIGPLIQQFGVVFISRSRSKAREVQESLLQVLGDKRRVCVFPEGTTNDGRSLHPFKASVFNLAEVWQKHSGEALPVQPVSVVYDSLDGRLMDSDAWDAVAWYGDVDFFPHLWSFMSKNSLNARIVYHDPIYISEGGRKALSAEAEKNIRAALPSVA